MKNYKNKFIGMTIATGVLLGTNIGTLVVYDQNISEQLAKTKEEMELRKEVESLNGKLIKKNNKITASNNNLNNNLLKKDKEIGKLKESIKKKDNEIHRVKQELKTKNVVIKGNSVENKSVNKNKDDSNESDGRTITVEATAYTNAPEENGLYNGKVVTKTGHNITNTIYSPDGDRIAACDPNIIPLGSELKVEGFSETFDCLDTGSAIGGKKLDLLLGSKSEAYSFGRKQVRVTILN